MSKASHGSLARWGTRAPAASSTSGRSSAMAKVELARMTWREAGESFRSNPVILLPMGSVEQHGPHVPVGDYRYATEVANRIALRTGAIVAPTIPWGYSEHFRPFPGTLSVRP